MFVEFLVISSSDYKVQIFFTAASYEEQLVTTEDRMKTDLITSLL